MITPKRLIPGSALTNALVTYYTVSSAVISATMKQLIFCNTDTLSHSFTMNVIPPAGAASVANTVFSAVVIQAGETKIFGLTENMPTGYFIQAKADVGAVVSMTASGMENT